MRIRRTFSQEFKREIAETIVSGKATQLELSRRYGIQPVIISKWKKEYYAGKFFENKNTDYARFEIRIKELERMVGRLTMENDTLKEIVKLVEPQKKPRSRYLHQPTGKHYRGVQTSEHSKIKTLLQAKERQAQRFRDSG